MEITKLCHHSYARWNGKTVNCAVCSLQIGTKFPPQGSPAHNALMGIFETDKYRDWMWAQTRNTVASTMTIAPNSMLRLGDDEFVITWEDL